MAGSSIEPLKRLIEEFRSLPGIGEKSAERLSFHVLKTSKDEAMRLAYAIRDVKELVKTCGTCFNLSDVDPCEICRNPRRERAQLCVVEQAADLWALEKAGSFQGLYHVLQGRLSPLDGAGPEQLTIEPLRRRVRAGEIREVILATNPTVEGDATAAYLQQALREENVRVTRIAKGIPSGSTLEYASKVILADALEGRREL